MATVEETQKAFMTEALKEANRALQKGEVPVGAVVVCNNRIVARAHNLTERLNDPTAHAEMQAITAATSYLGGKYLDQCALYVTLEPCVMCAGALFWSQLGTLVYGASDPKRGYTLLSDQVIHPKTKVVMGILKDESADILQRFFAQKRGKD
ncbi:MAG TPA: nucleoside deaminase [Tenuifilaceae bacterium]|nr:nucleoside deaminase [Tenuifilaceae bacterium]